MSDVPLMAPDTQQRLQKLRGQAPHAVLLHGDEGVGLEQIARWYTNQSAELIEPQKSKTSQTRTITVEVIRELYERTRSTRNDQVFVISHAELMSLSAQHAFLKLLEEPNEHVQFVLTTHYPDRLLPTVRSRTMAVLIPRVEPKVFSNWLDRLSLDATKRRQIEFAASGRPALARQLLDQPKQLEELAQVVRDAQVFIGHNRYAAASLALQYASSRDRAAGLVDAAVSVLTHTLKNTPTPAHLTRLEQLDQIQINLHGNASPRLQLLSFVVQ